MIAMATAIITAIIEFAAGQLLYTRARSRYVERSFWLLYNAVRLGNTTTVHHGMLIHEIAGCGVVAWSCECSLQWVCDLPTYVCRMTRSVQDMPPPQYAKTVDDPAEIESGDASSIASGDAQVLKAGCWRFMHCQCLASCIVPATGAALGMAQ